MKSLYRYGTEKNPNIKMNYSIYLYFNHISYFTLKYANRLKICEMFEYTIGEKQFVKIRFRCNGKIYF